MSETNPFAGRFTTSEEKRNYVMQLFSSIPNHYDRMNRIMSLGLDMSWRRKTVRLANFRQNGLLLDLATGTGDMIVAAQRILPEARFIGLDFCAPLLQIAREKMLGAIAQDRASLIQGDALRLPFEDNVFDGAFTAFALRNVVSVVQVFKELYRVIRPGGKVASLEMVKQSHPALKKMFWFYFQHFIPRLGRWLTSYPDAYSYLPLSIENFYTAGELEEVMAKAGWQNIRSFPVMFRNVAIHIAEKSG